MSLEGAPQTATYHLSVEPGYASSLLVVVTATLAVAACGANKSAEPPSTLESWRVAACDVLASYGEELAPPPTDDDVPSSDPGDELRRQIKATRGVVAKLRAIPLQDESRADAERFIEILALSAASKKPRRGSRRHLVGSIRCLSRSIPRTCRPRRRSRRQWPEESWRR
jgi:hypothetical protein